MSVLYSYPSNSDKALIRREMPQRLAARKKLSRRMMLSVAMSLVIALIAVLSDNIIAAVLLLILAVFSAAVSIIAVRLSLMSFEEEQTTVTENTLIHETTLLSGRKRRYKLDITKVVKSYQNTVGDLVLVFSDESAASVVDIKKGSEIPLPNTKSVTVVMRTTKTKLFLINEMSDVLHYPKRDYKLIEDDDLDDYGERKHWSDRL